MNEEEARGKQGELGVARQRELRSAWVVPPEPGADGQRRGKGFEPLEGCISGGEQ